MNVRTSSAALCLLLTDPFGLMRVPVVQAARWLRMSGIPYGSDVTRSSSDGDCVSHSDVSSYRDVASFALFKWKQDSHNVTQTSE
jgi:hypothetical protein